MADYLSELQAGQDFISDYANEPISHYNIAPTYPPVYFILFTYGKSFYPPCKRGFSIPPLHFQIKLPTSHIHENL